MSINLDDVDLSQVQTSFEIDTKNKAIEDCSWIEIINESDFTCTVNAGSINIQVLAWEAYPIKLQEHTPPVWQSIGASFPITVTPRLLSTMVSQPYSTVLTGVLYLTGEEPSSKSPRPLVRQAFIPNNVGTTAVGSTLINQGNAPGTTIIELQPSDVLPANTNPTVLVDNSGNMTIKGDNAGALTELLQLIAGASPSVIIAALNILTTIVGSLKVNQNASIQGSPNSGIALFVETNATSQRGIVIAGTSGQTGLLFSLQDNTFANKYTADVSGNTVQSGTTNGVFIDTNSGASKGRLGSSVANAGDILDATPTGLFLKSPAGGLNYQAPNGTTKWSISAMSKFTGTGSGNFNHNLGTTPDIIVCNPCTTNLSSQTIGFGARNSTQVTVTSGNNTLSWEALAIKF